MQRSSLINLLIAVSAFSVAVVLVEIGLRVLGLGYGNAPMDSHPLLHHSHPKDYEFLSYDENGEYGGHIVKFDEFGYSTDPKHDERVIHQACCTSSASTRVAFMGDSFVEAIQVPYRRSFVGRLANHSNRSTAIRNFGVSSYCPVLERIQWDLHVRAFAPSHVFLMLYFNDIRDDLKYHASAKLSDKGIAQAVEGPSRFFLIRVLRSLYIARLLRRFQLQIVWYMNNPEFLFGEEPTISSIEKSPTVTEVTSTTLLDLKDAVNKTGAKFYLMAVPSKSALREGESSQAKQFADNVAEWAEVNAIEYIDLKPVLADGAKRGKVFFDIDIHFNEWGHQVIAEHLTKRFPNLFGECRC